MARHPIDDPRLHALFRQWVQQRGAVRPGEQLSNAEWDKLFQVFLLDVAQRAAGVQGAQVIGASANVINRNVVVADNGAGAEIEDRRIGPPSDFDELIVKRAQSLHAVGGDQLAAEALLQQHNRAAANAAAPPVSLNPLSAIDQVLGSSTVLQAGQQPVEVARWTGDTIESRAVTITIGQAQLAARQISKPNQPIQARPYAILQWGNRAQVLTANIDALLGTQFTIDASFVSLQMAMQPLTTYPLNNPVAAAMSLSGYISFGTIERGTSPVTYTWYSDTFVTDSPNITIPPFASAFTVYATSTASTDTMQINMFDIGGTLIASAYALPLDASKAITVNLPGNAVSLSPQNIAAQAQHVAIVFRLSL